MQAINEISATSDESFAKQKIKLEVTVNGSANRNAFKDRLCIVFGCLLFGAQFFVCFSCDLVEKFINLSLT